MTATVVLPQNIKNSAVTIVAADTSSLKTICTADTIFWDLYQLQVCSDDTSNRTLSFYLTTSGSNATDYLIGSVVVATLAGTDGVVSVKDVLADTLFARSYYDAFANKHLPLDGVGGVILKCKSLTTVTAAKTLTIYATLIKS